MHPGARPLTRVRSLLAAVLCAGAPLAAQTGPAGAPQRAAAAPSVPDPAEEFLAPYGLDNFPDHYVEALSALLRARTHYEAGQVGQAKTVLDALWAQHPVGHPSWGGLPTQPFGLFIGSPPAYYALRMLSDTVEWRLANPGQGAALRTARLTVVLVGKSSGIEPQNATDLAQGTGVFVQHTLDPLLLADGNAVVHQSLELFREYVVAATEGALDVEVQVLHLPDLELPVHAYKSGSFAVAGLVDAESLWWSIPEPVIEATDWWWVLYPSHVPEQHLDFAGVEFITGGMGTGAQAGSPYFVIDDRWLVRKPPHLGSGPYSDVEREAYLPQWLQHEFFHYLFRTYPEFGLEDTPHQWFDTSTWPPDFVGTYEADYFHEALHKRLQNAATPLVKAMRYATAGAPWHLFDVGDLLGSYQRSPVLNDWHLGSIQLAPQLEWQNQAGVDWNLQDDVAHGRLPTGPDCPYFGTWSGSRFDVALERDALGDLLPVLSGFFFNGDLYERIGP